MRPAVTGNLGLRRFVTAACLAFLFVFGNACGNTAAQPQSSGIPFDWSHRHVVATGYTVVEPGAREHRLYYAWLRRDASARARRHGPPGPKQRPVPSGDIDWNVNLGAPMADGTFPAKYNFNLPGETPTCSDFAVYGLNVAGHTGGQANLVGLTNLYSGTAGGNGLCNGNTGGTNAATLKFAYNGSTIGGAITNSLTLSEDGKKIAYAESTGSATVLHVVTIPPGAGTGTVTAATVPPTIKSVPSSGSWAGDSYSSVWVDYANDLAYLGTDDGVLHKIQNLFCSTPTCKASPVDPTEITGIWPVALPGAGALTSPVQDPNGVIYVAGATSGKLYAVTSAGSVTTSTQTFMPNSIVDGPILDVDSNGATQALYWFSNSKSATSNPTVRVPQLVQTNSALTSFQNYSLMLNGTESWGNGGTTVIPVHAGTFDNAFYSNRNGNMWACGWWQNSQYGGNHQGIVRFGVNGATVTPDVSKIYSQTSPDWVAPDRNNCAPLTEVVDNAGVDHLFVASRTGYVMPVGNCTSPGAWATCIYGFTVSSSGSPAAYSLNPAASYQAAYNNNDYPSGMVVDNTVDPSSYTCGPNKNQTCAQASSIYFTIGNNAIKLTQAQLQ